VTSSRQEAANQKNGPRSRGPKTDEGKAISAMNSLSHGLTAESLTTPGESAKLMKEVIDAIVDDLQPLGALEEELALDVAICSWRLRRAPRAEAGLIRQWLLVQRSERLAEERASRPEITPELLKQFGYKEPPPPSEEDLRRWEEEARQKEGAELGEAISIDSAGPNALAKLARYEAALSRRRDRSLAALLALQRERQGDLHRELNA
jgi:hypothetical protein